MSDKIPEDFEDKIEHAFWCFNDKLSKKNFSDRDCFKQTLRRYFGCKEKPMENKIIFESEEEFDSKFSFGKIFAYVRFCMKLFKSLKNHIRSLKMFETLKIKRLQRKILQRGMYEQNIDKAIEELKELIDELEFFQLLRKPCSISALELQRHIGNMQKEIADVENIICKLKLMFVRTAAQRQAYRQGKKDIVYALKEYLRRGM